MYQYQIYQKDDLFFKYESFFAIDLNFETELDIFKYRLDFQIQIIPSTFDF